jgi:transposase
MFINKFKSILSLAGEDTDAAIGTVDVKSLRDALGRPLDTETLATLADLQRFYREADRIVKECDQLMKRHVEQIRRKAKEATPLSRRESMLLRLTRMKSIGFRTAWLLVHELFWKQFANVRGVGSASGLAAVPFSSGLTDKCAGISRRSNGRLRASLVELAWLWVRHQPGSALTHWFRERTDAGISRRRMKKVAIVAVARKLAVALWKFLERDEAIEGARLKTA